MEDIRRKSFLYDAGIVLQTLRAVSENVVNLGLAAVSRTFCG